MTDKEDRDIKEVNIESNDIGTEGGKSWDNCLRITLRSSEKSDTIDALIKKSESLVNFIRNKKK